jgi:hypothetical protein
MATRIIAWGGSFPASLVGGAPKNIEISGDADVGLGPLIRRKASIVEN